MALSESQLKAAVLIHTHGPGTSADWQYNKIADACGVEPRTLRNWRNLPEFQDALRKLPAEQVKNKLFEKAVVSGETQAIRVWLERYDDTPTRSDDPLQEILDYTDDDLYHATRAIVEHYGGSGDRVDKAYGRGRHAKDR